MVFAVAIFVIAQAQGQSKPCVFPLTVEITGKNPAFKTIQAGSVSVRLAGRIIPVKSVRLDRSSQVLIVLDNSGSMQKRRSSVLRLTRDILEGIPKDVKDVGLTTFSDVAIHAQGRESALKALDEIEARSSYGRTRLLDSMEDSARYFRAGSHTLMIVISDGADNKSRQLPNRVKQDLLKLGVRVSSILLISDRPDTVEEEFGPLDFLGISEATGGNVINIEITHADASARIFSDDAAVRLMQYYRVGIDAPSKEGKLQVQLIDGNGKKAKDLKAHYPRDLNCIQ